MKILGYILIIIGSLWILSRILQMLGVIKTKSWPDEIDNRKATANLFVLKHGSYGLAEQHSRFDEGKKELLKFATNSIKKIDPIGGLPLGFTLEFAATYPDVVLWWNDLSDENQGKLLKNFDENDLLNKDKKVKQKYLRVIIDAYKANGAELECAYDKF